MDSERRIVVRRFICENFLVDDKDFADDESLLQKEIMDSTGVLELISFLEERFGIKVADEEVVPRNLDSVTKLCGFLAAKVAVRLDHAARGE